MEPFSLSPSSFLQSFLRYDAATFDTREEEEAWVATAVSNLRWEAATDGVIAAWVTVEERCVRAQLARSIKEEVGGLELNLVLGVGMHGGET